VRLPVSPPAPLSYITPVPCLPAGRRHGGKNYNIHQYYQRFLYLTNIYFGATIITDI
jgi:hypothetical protein